MIAPGKTISSPNARYLVQAERGRGGFGIAWRATRQVDGRAVVLKELRLDRLADWKAMQLFEREAQVMSELSHDAIPEYIEFFGLDSDGEPFDIVGAEPRESFTTVLVQEFIVGENLDERRRAHKRYEPSELVTLLETILEVLAYLHDLSPPVIHRDINPRNVVRSEDGDYYLVDFGAIQDRLRSGTMLGSTNVGTFGFIPPEQAMGHTKPASDLFALAMTVLVAGTGRTPEELPLDETTAKVDDSVFPQTWPRNLTRTLDKMLEPIVGNRIATARDALKLLRRKPGSKALVKSDAGKYMVTVSLGRTIQIGRAENVDIRVSDQSVSRYHASIAHRTDGRFVLRDLGSARGTWVDGKPVTEVRLHSGTRVRLGMAHFEILLRGDEVMLIDRGRDETGAIAVVSGGDLVQAQSNAQWAVVLALAVFALVTCGLAIFL